jgi:signal transduction histidine kinase
MQMQNRELVATLAELRERQEDLLSLTRELEDTNRGIVALYAEIEDKAERLRRADEMKSRFLSNTSHELRTPLSSIRALAKLLLDRMDGDLTVEQERQVRFIESAADRPVGTGQRPAGPGQDRSRQGRGAPGAGQRGPTCSAR